MRGPTRCQQHCEQAAVGHDRRGHRQQCAPPAPAVGQLSGDRDRGGEEQHGDHLHLEEVDVVEAQAHAVWRLLAGAVAQRPGGDDVEDRVGGQHDEGAQDQLSPVVPEDFCDRGFHFFAAFYGAGEHRGFGQLQSHVQTDRHHDGAEQERYPPAPRQEGPVQVRFGVGVPQPDQQAQEHPVGQ